MTDDSTNTGDDAAPAAPNRTEALAVDSTEASAVDSTEALAVDSTEAPAVEPEPEPQFNQEWLVHITTNEGWEYDVRIGLTFNVSYAVDVSESPPGKARIMTSTDGASSVVFSPTLEGRTAPELGERGVAARYEVPFEWGNNDQRPRPGGGSCRYSPSRLDPDTSYLCQVETSSGPSSEMDETRAKQRTEALKALQVAYYTVAFGNQCTLRISPTEGPLDSSTCVTLSEHQGTN